MLKILWLLAGCGFTAFAIWGSSIAHVMSWGRLTGNETRFIALRWMACLCALGSFAESAILALRR